MSLESQVAALVSAANKLTSEIAGKMKGIDKKVDEATKAVPVAIKEYSEQNFYIDASSGNDNGDGSERSPFRTIKQVGREAVNGGTIRIYLRRGQVHVIEDTGVSIQSGSIAVYGYGTGEKPKLVQQTKYSAFNDAHYGAGFGVRNGSILFSSIDVDTFFDVDNVENKKLEVRSGLILDAQSSTSVLFYNCHIRLNEMPIMAVFAGNTGRDIFLSDCDVEVLKNTTGNSRLVRSRTGSSFGTLRLDVYRTSLVGGLTWSDLVNYYSDKRNVLTNLVLD
ncbi:hypothetical protein [Vreelandella sp. GE22]